MGLNNELHSTLPAVQDTQPIITGMPSTQEMMVYQTWAKNAEASQMYRNIGKADGIMMIMLAAREYGIGPAQALNGGLHIIEGKVELSARMMSALIRRSKHKMNIIESTDKKCVIEGTRTDTLEKHTASFTIEEAQQAGLIKEKGGWKKSPIDMLYARAISRLARQLFSDVIGIGYIEGEISPPGASNDEIPIVEQSKEDLEKEEELLQTILGKFEKEDAFLVMEFIRIIQQHHKISRREVLDTFIKDPQGTSNNFHQWKKQRKT